MELDVSAWRLSLSLDDEPALPEHASGAPSVVEQLVSDLDTEDVDVAHNGTSAVYILHARSDASSKAVFKPVEAGDAASAVHEQAAFVLDGGAAGVPETTVSTLDVRGRGAEFGSVQRFVEGRDASDLGSNLFSVEDVHRIGVLDVRLLNRDRHAGNLVMSASGELVPIDHALAFPSALADGELAEVSSELFLYPQAKEPFSERTLAAIAAIDEEADLDKLNDTGVSEGSQIGNWMATVLLKKAAASGRTLHDVGGLVQRRGDRSQASHLETLFDAAMALQAASDEVDFFTAFQGLADNVLLTAFP